MFKGLLICRRVTSSALDCAPGVQCPHCFNLFVLFQVSGELSNNGQPLRRFMQTFVLAPQSPKKYYVHNDIFRYQVSCFSLRNEL